MTVSKIDNGKWFCDIRPNGIKGKRYRKSFKTKAEALHWEAWIIKSKQDNPDWEPKAQLDNRKLSELIELWFSGHGVNLKSGKDRKLMLDNLCKRLGNPRARLIKATDFISYRVDRQKTDISINTLNHAHVYLSAVFNELIRIGEWTGINPLQKVKKLKESEKELYWLKSHEISELLETLKSSKSDCYHIARICLATGARWSEAENLELNHINGNKITYIDTKNCKNRTVPVSKAFIDSIPKREGRLFKYSYSTLKRFINKTSIELPDGQLSHVLRHTFASHFIMNGGNILVLQKILGHSSLDVTMRYAHLAPEHLEEAITKNPLSGC